MNLNTNKVITHCKITPIPITQTVIDRVESLAANDGMKPDLVFQNRKGDLLQDDDLIAGVDDDDKEDNNDGNENETNDDNESTSTSDEEDEEELFEL